MHTLLHTCARCVYMHDCVCAWVLNSSVSMNIDQSGHGGFRDRGRGFGGGRSWN